MYDTCILVNAHLFMTAQLLYLAVMFWSTTDSISYIFRLMIDTKGI